MLVTMVMVGWLKSLGQKPLKSLSFIWVNYTCKSAALLVEF